MSSLRAIFHWIGKIVGLFAFLFRMKRVSKKIARLRVKQMALIVEITQMRKAGKSTTVLEMQTASLSREIIKLTRGFVDMKKAKNGKSERVHPHH